MAGTAPLQGPTPVGVGPSDPAVARVQQWLKVAGYWTGAVDGVWQQFLGQQLERWQRSTGLEPTGEIDDQTIAKLDEIGKFLNGASAPAQAEPTVAGATSTTPTAAPTVTPPSTQAAVGDNPDGYFQIPGGAQLWKRGSDWYVVYMVPGTYTPMAWKVENPTELSAIVGPDKQPVAQRVVGEQEWKELGVLVFGVSRELANTSEHPFDGYLETFSKEAEIRPWLRDPEIAAAQAMAVLEGRSLTEAEIQTTSWWKGHNAQERAWMLASSSDPATAKVTVEDNRRMWRGRLIQAGVKNPHDTLINWLSDRVTAGTWSDSYAQSQILAIVNPHAGYKVDEDLKPLLEYVEGRFGPLETSVGDIRNVRKTVEEWLGPALAKGWNDRKIEDWAKKIAADPSASLDLEKVLQGQRLAAFPEYDNPNVTYEDIAGVWRGVWSQSWGQMPDETDPLFTTILRTNDRAKAEQILRREGLNRQNGTVAASLLQDVTRSDLAQGVRGTV